MRFLDLSLAWPVRRGETVHCQAREAWGVCGRATREGKPRCIDHVHQLPYARIVAAREVQRENELAALRRGKRTMPSPMLEAEVLQLLATCGRVTDGFVSRLLVLEDCAPLPPELGKGVHHPVAHALTQRLVRRGLARRVTTRRGAPAIEDPGLAARPRRRKSAPLPRPEPLQPVPRAPDTRRPPVFTPKPCVACGEMFRPTSGRHVTCTTCKPRKLGQAAGAA